MEKCENCKSSQVESSQNEGDTLLTCNHCGYTVENGVVTQQGKKTQQDFILTFIYKLGSQDWDGEIGTPFDEETTKEMLLEDLKEHLGQLSGADEYELLTHCSFQSTKKAQLQELKELAIEEYEDIHGLDNFLEALSTEDKEKYKQLREEVRNQ